MATVPVQESPPPLPVESVEERFHRLAAAWRQVARSHRRQPVRYDHPIYQEVVDMGPAVVPFLLRAVQEFPPHWFWALHRITGADPIAPDERGDFVRMREAWLRWESEHGNGTGQRETPEPDLEQKFQQLAGIWEAETAHLSSTTAIINHPAYQEIIGLGPAVIPLILRECEQRPGHWFHALHVLTGAEPMDPADCGKIYKIAEAWVRWGKANGYRW